MYYGFVFEKKGVWAQERVTGRSSVRTGVTYKTAKEASQDVARLNLAVAQEMRDRGELNFD